MASWIRIRVQEGKNDPQNRKKFINFLFWSSGCSLLRAEGFSCSLDVLLGGLGISNCNFNLKRFKKNFQLYSIFVFNFWSSKPGSRLDPDPDSLNPDPQHWSIVHFLIYFILSLLYCDRKAICVSGPLQRREGGGKVQCRAAHLQSPLLQDNSHSSNNTARWEVPFVAVMNRSWKKITGTYGKYLGKVLNSCIIAGGFPLCSVPDPYVFGPPGSASGSVIYLYGSGSFHQQAKNEEKPWFLYKHKNLEKKNDEKNRIWSRIRFRIRVH